MKIQKMCERLVVTERILPTQTKVANGMSVRHQIPLRRSRKGKDKRQYQGT